MHIYRLFVQDQDFLDPMNPAAGQQYSLADVIAFTQSILTHKRPLSLLSENQLDRWFTPVYSFEEDDRAEMGMM